MSTEKHTPTLICVDCELVIDVAGGAYDCERCGKGPICAGCCGDDANQNRTLCEECSVSEEDLTDQAIDVYCETGLTPRQLVEQRKELVAALEQIRDAERDICRRCEGNGALYADGKAHYYSEHAPTIPCGHCGGSGRLMPEDASEIAAAALAKTEGERHEH